MKIIEAVLTYFTRRSRPTGRTGARELIRSGR